MIVGLVGRARSGKSTVGDAMLVRARERDIKASIYDIGEVVKQYCVQEGLLPDVPRETMTAEQLDILVKIGKLKREQRPDFWITNLADAHRRDPDSLIIVPNIRYMNEYKMVRQYLGYTIRVLALNRNGSPHISRDRDPNHASETELLNVPADFHLTAYHGESRLLKEMATTLFDYLAISFPKSSAPQFDREYEGIPV